ncbi:tRNA (uracil-O(2)-)-methyltransferase [Penicillium subrubescens]|uniref:tRNA (uracil-O(2)-)-methyltransferase n=1 Tax=Penicillium subrubescens TaxID=1316194 RepID=A0A1Q5UMD5_9EURO|nr:tRNA (uracil-O(2)-)-methyltransferase [Penicillium subrubescens]KAJ5895815.1 tRNA (uracil-O(2)-)-methyltransferase [Penicillium subrubescens]OKP13656.1 tRNA (uracil-O(2)-)-methyltransferase [Penicillium subrubescens]
MPNRKIVRNLSRLSGKSLKETLESSHEVLEIDSDDWLTSPDLSEDGLPFSTENFYETAVFLMANPNITSSHLFRADILFDSQGLLKTPQQDEELAGTFGGCATEIPETPVKAKPAAQVTGFDLVRTVIRKLIPRNQNIDRPLVQTCHFYKSKTSSSRDDEDHSNDDQPSERQRVLTMFLPHIESQDDVPFYHPQLRGLATLYDVQSSQEGVKSGTMSVHFLPFSSDIPERLERTLHLLLNFYVRLTRGAKGTTTNEITGKTSSSKDNLVPRHLAQNTYARLKNIYAADLCENWAESTEPSKHVYEDLAITAFLIELWRMMYGVAPAKENPNGENTTAKFPGFVDMACGNGVLVYVLLMEGYSGCGFDARRRKSWSVYPDWVQERLTEKILIPKPFADITEAGDIGVNITTGDFPRDTFIISNHADELTVWTPLIAALACPESPLPFLAIPCCSHALSGSRYRYPLPKGTKPKTTTGAAEKPDQHTEQNPQPASGDLKALRAAKQAEKTESGMWTSMYGLLTKKTITVAEEAGYQVEKTLLRIPSTRNMGVIGGRQLVSEQWKQLGTSSAPTVAEDQTKQAPRVVQNVMDIVERECSREGGIQASAQIWIERARGLQKDRGKATNPADDAQILE